MIKVEICRPVAGVLRMVTYDGGKIVDIREYATANGDDMVFAMARAASSACEDLGILEDGRYITTRKRGQ